MGKSTISMASFKFANGKRLPGRVLVSSIFHYHKHPQVGQKPTWQTWAPFLELTVTWPAQGGLEHVYDFPFSWGLSSSGSYTTNQNIINHHQPYNNLVGGLEHDFYDFPYIGNNNPNWLSYVSEGWLNHQTVTILIKRIWTVTGCR
jgi:hypothetical protein